MAPTPADEEMVARLTGLRSSKPNFYKQYRRTSESLDRSIRALESASAALLAVTGGAGPLVDGFVVAAVGIFDVPWAAALVEHPALGSRPHLVAADAAGVCRGGLPPAVEPFAGGRRGGRPQGAFVADLSWEDGGRGWLAAAESPERVADDLDRALLATVAHQMIAGVHSAHLLAQTRRLRSESGQVRRELEAMRERELVVHERERIARDLHDTVAQEVLGIGMQLERCRQLTDRADVAAALVDARELARSTVTRIRATIAELTTDMPPPSPDLDARLRAAAAEFAARGLQVALDLGEAEPGEGDAPAVPAGVDKALEMVVREALANAAVHSGAQRAAVAVTRERSSLVVAVDDAGCGSPETVRANLRAAGQRPPDGYRRGLLNISERLREVGGALVITDSPLGGVRIRAEVPLRSSR